MTVNIVFPVLDEELRLEKGIRSTLAFLDKNQMEDCILTIVDNGSTDATLSIMEQLKQEDTRIHLISLKQKGFGLAFKKAVEQNECDIVGYMDVDLSTPLEHFTTVLEIFEKESKVPIVKGNRLDRNSQVEGRKWSREVTSRGLDFIIKTLLHSKVSDMMEGFQFFRKDVAKQLIAISSDDNGWFYCAELLLRAERLGMEVKEIPVKWEDDYNTKVNVVKLIRNYLKRIFYLRKELRKMK